MQTRRRLRGDIAPDGAGYPDLQAVVDDSKLLAAGGEVLGAADTTSPGEPVRLETFTRRTALSWGDVGGGALLVLVCVGAVCLATWTRRRRRADE